MKESINNNPLQLIMVETFFARGEKNSDMQECPWHNSHLNQKKKTEHNEAQANTSEKVKSSNNNSIRERQWQHQKQLSVLKENETSYIVKQIELSNHG